MSLFQGLANHAGRTNSAYLEDTSFRRYTNSSEHHAENEFDRLDLVEAQERVTERWSILNYISTCDVPRLIIPSAPANQIDIVVSAWAPFVGPYFVRLNVGRERRNKARLLEERQSRPVRVAAFHWAAITFVLGNFAFGLFCTAYLIKCWLNIDLLPLHSPFHPLYVLFFTR